METAADTRWLDLAVKETPVSGPRRGPGGTPLEVGGASAVESGHPMGGAHVGSRLSEIGVGHVEDGERVVVVDDHRELRGDA